jgi:hypothetical protein
MLPGEESPFSLVSIAPPPRLPPPQLRSGTMAELCRDPKIRLYTIGAGMMLIACGLVLGATPTRQIDSPDSEQPMEIPLRAAA